MVRSYGMKAKKKAAVIALAAVMACGTLTGCKALTVTNSTKDYNQVIATVDLSRSAAFREGGEFADYADFVGESSIFKRQMMWNFVTSGYYYIYYYGWTYERTFDKIASDLVERQVNVQYAMAYLAAHGDADGHTYNDIQAYKKLIDGAGENATYSQKRAAALSYFLEEDEEAKALYDTRVSINTQLDTYEEDYIDALDEHDHTADADVRTTPTGAETESEDFYDTDYRIYTGLGKETSFGSYEKQKGSNATTRRYAYNKLIASLYTNDQLKKDEDSSVLESTDYFASELVEQYETILLDKLTDKFEQEEEAKLNGSWAEALFNETVSNQRGEFASDKDAFETAFNAISDSSFVFTAPTYTDGTGEHYDEYGYVLNILLPFSTLQTDELNNYSDDFGDKKGGKFAARAGLSQQLKATDQRETWFTGHDDYSFEAEDAYVGSNGDRKYLFFENSTVNTEDVKDKDGNVIKSAQYEKIKNYFGKYSYNGTVVFDDDGDAEDFEPVKINIDGFLAEMEGYMKYASNLAFKDDRLAFATTQEVPADYYTRDNFYYTAADEAADPSVHAGQVDYNKFLYKVGKIDYFQKNAFNPDHLFVEGTPENVAFSVINELSFAYNTDTAGLNSYLGYMISPYKTSYMAEFEFAAQLAVKGGAGTYAVVPTDYGWHIIYCTFSFADIAADRSAFTFDYEQRKGGKNEVENSFSYTYFELLKTQAVSSAASNRSSDIINDFVKACSTIYESTYADLSGLDS